MKKTEISQEEWLKERKKGIGGSDAASIIGLNPFKSAFQVYLEKTGELQKKEDNEAMRQGRDLEDYVAQRFMEQTGKKVRRNNNILYHPEYDFIFGNVDRVVVGEKAGLECKTINNAYNRYNLESGEYPVYYYVQCMHYLAVTGFDKWYLAVLDLGKAFYIYEIQRNEDEINALIEAEKYFWMNHVLKLIPPAPDGSEYARNFINKMFPKAAEGFSVELFGYEEKIKKILELKNNIKDLEKELEKLEQEIKVQLGESEKGICQGFVVTWKNIVSNRFDTDSFKKEHADLYNKYLKTSTYRKFEIKYLTKE